MLVVRLPIAAPAPTRYTLMPRLAGFSSSGLVSLMRFTESTLAAGSLDDVTGGRVATSGAAPADATANIEAALAGGGLKLTGLRNIVPTSVDITQPFTVLLAATLPMPANLTPQGLLTVGNFPTAGIMTFYQLSSAAAMNVAYPFYYIQSKLGAIDGTSLGATALPQVGLFSSLTFFIIKHLGNGVLSIEQHRGATASVASVAATLANIQGPAGSLVPVQPVKIGGLYAGIGNASGGIYDAIAVYNRATSSADDQAFFDAAAALALSRGRS